VRTANIGGVRVSRVGLGTSALIKHCDERASIDVVHAALDCGIRFFDTADSYGTGRCGRTEEFLGRVLHGIRDSVVLATKFGTDFGGQAATARADWARRAIQGSLRRLRTDRVDIYLLHVPDPVVPIEETLGALAELVQAGYARVVGCCNLSPAALCSAAAAARELELSAFGCVQDEYSVVHREAEDRLLPVCRDKGLSFVCYAPLANGLLTGKYAAGAVPGGTRLDRIGPVRAAALLAPDIVARASRFLDFCRSAGLRPESTALAWLLSRIGVGSVIPGATTADQVRRNAVADRLVLDSQQLAAIDRLSASGVSA
jgi:1-deoxyxylulose-5-phosphate synthase